MCLCVTEPPVTEPPITEPLANEPPVTEPSVAESRVPGMPTSLKVRPMTTSIAVSWTPPQEQDILISGYMIAYGIGSPYHYQQVVDAKQRYHTIKNLGERPKPQTLTLTLTTTSRWWTPNSATTPSRTWVRGQNPKP